MLIIVLACIFSSILLATIGCITIWNKYAYLSDGIIHILLLAALLNSIFDYPLVLCSAIVSTFFVTSASYLKRYFDDHNLVLNVTTTFLIALGIIVADILNIDLNIESLFFGDILFVNKEEVVLLIALTSVIGALIYKNFNTIVISALNEEIALSYNVSIEKFKFIILLLSAVSISIIVQIIGGLMISSLSIIPVFFSKIISKNPVQMLLNSIFFSMISTLAGLKVAFMLDFSVAATISMIQFIVLFLTFLTKKYIFDL
jgi:zinc transport system permease protein